MAWTTPATATVGQVLTAAFWNTQVRDNQDFLFTNANFSSLTKVTTAVTVVSTTTLTDLLNYTIAAGAIGTDQTVLATLTGSGLCNPGAVRAFGLKVILGGTTLYNTGVPVAASDIGIEFNVSASRFSWQLDLRIEATAAAASQFLSGSLVAGDTDGIPSTGYGADGVGVSTGQFNTMGFTSAGRTAVDMASAQALQVQIVPEVSHASLEWKMEKAVVAVIG